MTRRFSDPARLRAAYESQTGLFWDDDAGIRWLNVHPDEWGVYSHEHLAAKDVYIDLSDKSSWLSQQHCLICRESAPLAHIPVRISPVSVQRRESDAKVAFKRGLAAYLRQNPIRRIADDKRVCLAIFFVCSVNNQARDLDNMAKLFVDGVKDVLFGDDRNIDHLNLVRFEHAGEEFVFLRIFESQLNDHSDVLVKRMSHKWGVGPIIRLEDFMPARDDPGSRDVLDH